MRSLPPLYPKEPRQDVGVRPAVGGGPTSARQEPSSGVLFVSERRSERQATPVTLLDVTGVTDTKEVIRSKRLVLPTTYTLNHVVGVLTILAAVSCAGTASVRKADQAVDGSKSEIEVGLTSVGNPACNCTGGNVCKGSKAVPKEKP